VPVRLIHDPYGLVKRDAIRVHTAEQLRTSFREIDGLLACGETAAEYVYIIDSVFWTHYNCYQQIMGVSVEEFLPRLIIQQRFHQFPPDWVSDELIMNIGFLNCELKELTNSNWEETATEWLLPGYHKIATLSDWLIAVYRTPLLADEKIPNQIKQVLWAQFIQCAKGIIQFHEMEALESIWRDSSPKAFVEEALTVSAFMPFQTKDMASGFYGQLERASSGCLEKLPLVFPLPVELHKQVSQKFTDTLRKARLEDRDLTRTLLSLNAIWEGVSSEIQNWLNAQPNALTLPAAEHLESLPGNDAFLVTELLHRFKPYETPAEWSGLDSIETWIHDYSHYIRSAFCRRTLPENWSADPAASFSKWIKKNITVTFNHQEYGFGIVARRVSENLRQGRIVILVLIDALAYHLVDVLIQNLSVQVEEQPSSIVPMFVPVPTLTEVSKLAVLTGFKPNQCTERIEALIPDRYGLTQEEVLLVDSWNDPFRARIQPQHRLIVYRENRLDDRLDSIKSYSELLDEFHLISKQVADRISNWITDLKCWVNVAPVVIITGDHGFTYGPPSNPQGATGMSLGKHLRCIAIEKKHSTAQHPKGSVTVLDKESFCLNKSYLAATSRQFGQGTLSGWVMQHGGLLPEEVIVPVVTWFAGETRVLHPVIAIVDGACRRAGLWELEIEIRNTSALQIRNVFLAVSIPNVLPDWTKTIQILEPNQKVILKVNIAGPDVPECQSFAINVSTRVMTKSGVQSSPSRRQFLVTHKVQLVERTTEQDTFEEMFN
jgi:hypothetical protein